MVSSNDIRAVTFDVGGTLIEPWPSVGHVYAEVAAGFGLSGIAPEQLNRQFAAAWKSRGSFDYSRAAWRELVNRTFAGLCPEPPGLACFDAIYGRFATAATWRLFDDVLPAFAALKSRGLKLGAISNWDERLRPLLDELRLSRCFDVIVVSCDTGRVKPDPEIFLTAARQLGVPLGSILHVGDSAREDFAGAQAAGMRAVLVDRAGASPGLTVVPCLTRVVEGLGEASFGLRTD